MSGKTALIVGASGLVGRELVKCLLESQRYKKVILLVRTSLGYEEDKIEEKVIDFANLSDHKDCLKVNDVFCCLGTTIKKAKTKEAFK